MIARLRLEAAMAFYWIVLALSFSLVAPFFMLRNCWDLIRMGRAKIRSMMEAERKRRSA